MTQVQIPMDEVRKLIESNIRVEGTVNAVSDKIGRVEFRIDSHDKRIGAIEEKMIHNQGVSEGRNAVTRKFDKWAMTALAAVASVGAAALEYAGHKLGFL